MPNITRYNKLGFKVVLEQDWLNLALTLSLQQKDVKDARETLRSFILSSGKRSILTTDFAVNILRAWFDPDEDLVIFRDQLLRQAQNLHQTQWPVLHWACFAAAYPFLLSFSTIFGRLTALQNETTKAQILARLQDIYGTREAVERSLYYGMGSFINLGLILRSPQKNTVKAPDKIQIKNNETGLLIWKAMIHATQGNRLSVNSLRHSPALYAFEMPDIYVEQNYSLFPDLCFTQYANGGMLSLTKIS